MKDAPVSNRRLPAWCGSLLFHFVVLIFLSYYLTDHFVEHSAPGNERFAVGGIVLQTNQAPVEEPRQIVQQEIHPQESATPPEKESAPTETATSTAPDTVGSGTPQLPETQNVPSTLSGTGQQKSLQSGLLAGDATVQIFGTEGKGSKFVYVFDRSGSMNGGRFKSAQNELIQSLDSLSDFHQFRIIFYSGKGDITIWHSEAKQRKLVYATEIEKENAKKFVSGQTPSGGTYHLEPLLEALRHRPHVIFFLTDGERRDDLTDEQLRQIDRENRGGVQINVIQFGSGSLTDQPSEHLKRLAELHHGQYQYITVP